MTAFEQGQTAARAYFAAGDFDRAQPRNPYPLTREQRTGRAPMCAKHRAWYAGYSHECYVEFGDPSRDMARAERAFGC